MSNYFYVYYSYEEYGRGYIGKRQCKCLPEEDLNYFGTYKDKTFNPTQKIILDTFDTVEKALEAECILHDFYQVDKNPHFANKARQTSTKFFYMPSTEEAKENGKKSHRLGLGAHGLSLEERIKNAKKGGTKAAETNKRNKTGIFGMTEEQRSAVGKKVGEMNKKNKTGVCGLSFEELSENGKKYGKIGGNRASELKVGVHSLTPEQKGENGKKAHKMKRGVHGLAREKIVENGKKGGEKAKELGVGIHGRTKEEMQETGKKSGQKNYELGLGIHAQTAEQRKEFGRMGGSIGGKIVAARKYICLETGFVANAGNLTKYQRKRGIDTTKRRRIS
jgi:hypothetical protein